MEKKAREKPSMYFGKEVQDAIIEFNNSESKVHKDLLFSSKIYPAFLKLVENVIHNRKLYDYGILNYTMVKQDCICHLYDRLPKYSLSNGKAFSYFNRITIHWVFAYYNKLKKEWSVFPKSDQIISDDESTVTLNDPDYSRDLERERHDLEYTEELADFLNRWAAWGNDNLDHFYFVKNNKIVPFNQKDRQIANAIFDILYNCRNIDIYNKKALYLIIRDRVDVKTQSITDVVNVLKELYKDMYFDFQKNGTRYWHRFLYYPDGVGELTDRSLEELVNEQRFDTISEGYW